MDTLRIYLSTWNVGTNPPTQDLNSLLDFPAIHNKHKALPDFYMLGFQEVKSQPQNMVMDAIFSDPWTANVTRLLVQHGYVRVKSIRLQGLLLVVFTLRKHLLHLRDIESHYIRTGLGGMWGNKGAVSVRLSIYGCSICIVNSHLAPHDHLLEERIADYNNIIKSNTFQVKDTCNIMFHDYVFWLGDLNFRLSEKAPESSEAIVNIVRKAEKDDYSVLLQHDQLRGAMASGEAFSELKETLPTFPPTFKFEIGTGEYNTKRRPAWTDRILYKVEANNYENVTLKAEQLSYHSLPQYTLSDHKPVVADFNIKVRMRENVIKQYPRTLLYDGLDSVASELRIPEETVVFSHHTERCVEFAPIKDIWYIGDADLVAKYSLSRDVQVYADDWIAVYEADFTDIEDYITYEYASKVNSPLPSAGSAARNVVFSFPVGSGVRSPGFYRFLYFNQPCSEVISLLGISEPFEVRVNEEDDIKVQQLLQSSSQGPSTSSDASSQASSSAGGQEAPLGTMESLINDLTKLHVPGLKLNMLNDLSID